MLCLAAACVSSVTVVGVGGSFLCLCDTESIFFDISCGNPYPWTRRDARQSKDGSEPVFIPLHDVAPILFLLTMHHHYNHHHEATPLLVKKEADDTLPASTATIIRVRPLFGMLQQRFSQAA